MITPLQKSISRYEILCVFLRSTFESTLCNQTKDTSRYTKSVAQALGSIHAKAMYVEVSLIVLGPWDCTDYVYPAFNSRSRPVATGKHCMLGCAKAMEV
jgi:hypothetical protein